MTTAMPAAAAPADTERAYRVFEARVCTIIALSPHFLRVTFAGPDLESFANNGFDQRIKLVFPHMSPAGGGLDRFPRTDDWYGQWRGMPQARRNAFRTYTVREVIDVPAGRRVVVDVVRHGQESTAGPAGRWLAQAEVGSEVLIIGPNRRHPGPTPGGVEWHPPAAVSQLLIGGDETAVPAIASILGRLPGTAQGIALLEVPTPEDVLPLINPEGIEVRWVPRDRAHGLALDLGFRPAAAEVMGRVDRSPRPGPDPGLLETDHLLDETLWDVPVPVPVPVPDPAPDRAGTIYTWLAGEAGAVTRLRRHLVADLGFDRTTVAFMGYWRFGRAEN